MSSTDLAKLVVKLEAQTAKYQRDLDTANSKTKKFEKNTKASLKGISAGFVGLAASSILLKNLTQGLTATIAETQKYEASLKTATGSIESASVAMQALKDFASTTPYSLEQSITAFIKLRNLGLDPSESSLKSFGNTAVAMGKDLNQMIEAVADASTFEFERLKEFGIKAKQSGESVSFTFQGQTTKIAKNSEAVVGYLKRIGETNFAGAMDDQFNSLNGLTSNFSDNLDKVEVNLGKIGATDLISSAYEMANTALDNLNASMESGELEASIEAIANKFDFIGEAAALAATLVSDTLTDLFQQLPFSAEQSNEAIANTFSNLPENINAFIQIIVVEFAHAFDVIIAYAQNLVDSVAAVFTDDTLDDAAARFNESIRIIGEAREGSIINIMEERDTAIKSFDLQIQKAKDYRQALGDATAARKKSSEESGGTLGQFKVNAPDTSNVVNLDDFKKRADQIISETTPKLDQLKAKADESAMLFSKGLLNSEQFQLANDLYTSQIEDLTNKDITSFEEKLVRMEEQFLTEYEMLEVYKSEKLALLDDEKINSVRTAEEIATAKLAIEDRFAKDAAALKRAKIDQEINDTESAAKSILGIVSAFGSKSFQAQKNYAIADSLISIAAGVAKALNNPFPANLGFAAQVATQGAGLLATIKSTKPASTSASSISAGATSAGNYSTPNAVNEVQSQREINEEKESRRKAEITFITDEFTESPMRKLISRLKETGEDLGIEFAVRA